MQTNLGIYYILMVSTGPAIMDPTVHGIDIPVILVDGG